MKKLTLLISAIGAALAASTATLDPAHADAPIPVVTTLPHLAAHAREVGGDRVSVVALGRGDQDPHFVSPTPSLMVEANRARLYVEIGLELELWSEHVLDGARNADIRVGFPGHVYAAIGVPVLQKPAVISRSQGDVHPQGNPHVWLDPLNAIIEAQNIAEGLKRVDPAGAAQYDQRFAAYKERILKAQYGEDLLKILGGERLTSLDRSGKLRDFLEGKKYKGEPLQKRLGGWLGKMHPYKGAQVITYHQDYAYFANAYGIDVVGNVEPKPGIPPTPGHTEELVNLCKTTKVSALLLGPYHNVPVAEGIGEKAGVPVLVLPINCGAGTDHDDYFELMDSLVNKLSAALAKGGTK